MKRRNWLKATAMGLAVATINGFKQFAMATVPPKSKLVVFVNENIMPMDVFEKHYKQAAGNDVLLVPVRVPEDKTFDDVIRVYLQQDGQE